MLAFTWVPFRHRHLLSVKLKATVLSLGLYEIQKSMAHSRLGLFQGHKVTPACSIIRYVYLWRESGLSCAAFSLSVAILPSCIELPCYSWDQLKSCFCDIHTTFTMKIFFSFAPSQASISNSISGILHRCYIFVMT